MTLDELVATVQPGDVLLYKPGKGIFGLLISLKTWHNISHCEGYIGGSCSVASRDGEGVDVYAVRTKGLAMILRPKAGFDLNPALAWFFLVARGQKYDWLGLLRFGWRSKVKPVANENKQFCSEFLTRWYRQGGIDPFNGADADEIAPFQFAQSPVFTTIWSA